MTVELHGWMAFALMLAAVWFWPYKYTSTGYGRAAESVMSLLLRLFGSAIVLAVMVIYLASGHKL